ncbi:RNA-binding protein 34 [Pempheris klunzingeri]|uniref:RNA-binding protein 34 n=1 Tax=Pempheris klunzingeri TaxID=3127111 RepID=UPI00398045FA
MKKKLKQSEEASPGQQSADYVVGQVSGSVFQKKTATSESTLSALFSAATPAAPLLFQPAPKPVQRSSEPQREAPQVKGQSSQKKKKLKEKSEADQQLENREAGLQNADDDEQTSAVMKREGRKRPAGGGGTSVEQWVMKRQKLKLIKKEEATKRKRTVFVGNLPVGCTKKTLQRLFREKGAIESIRFRSVVREDPSMSRKVAAIQRKVHPKKRSINAYVVFKEEEGVSRALERNGLEIEKDFHIRVDRVTGGSSHDHKRSVFVGNLSFEITELAFRRHFEECGPVEAVRLVRDQNSGMGKGFGYVLFESADSVQLALKLDASKLEGRSIRVKRSLKNEKQQQKKKTDGKGTTGRGPAKGGGGGKSPNQQRSTKGSTSFAGQMVDPKKKTKKKGLKKKQRPNKTVHI